MATNGAQLDGWLAERADELKVAVQFLTRLPFVTATSPDASGISRAAWSFPVVGAGIGLGAAVIYALAHKLGVPPWPAAALSIAGTLLATGCLHEDGLADTADGFGGGATRERKLEIMRDSRIGTYGVCALVVALLLRGGALAGLADTGAVAFALIAAHGGARAVTMAFMALVPPARSDGLSASAGTPPSHSVLAAAVLGVLIIAVCLGLLHAFVAVILLAIVAALLAWLSLTQIEGQTGDVLGAVEQTSEIAILLVALG
jgi:adenosylcobinamide-GDP ribazoletransferase